MIAVDDAYATCAEITRREARNFSYGIRLLPREKRAAMSALYAFARRVDDIGDGVLPAAERFSALARVRDDVAATASGNPPAGDPVLCALADAMRHYPIAAGELLEVVEGCELDIERQRWETYEELEYYCTCVAGSIGRLSLSIFGSTAAAAPALANRLGIGLQLTNILRDIVEDRDTMGRVYVPRADLARFGCDDDVRGGDEALVALVRFEAERARAAYDEGLDLLRLVDRRSRACVGAMAGIYRRLLRRIEAEPLAVFRTRVGLSVAEKGWVAARALAGARP